jgi:dienelactone hydrolase
MKMKTTWVIIITIISFGFLPGATQAELVTKEIPYRHGDLQLRGFLAYDDSAKGKRPGILVVHEWWGLNEYVMDRAIQLARLGYVAFAADMYGQRKVTQHPEQASEWAKTVREDVSLWRGRAQAGLDVLKEQEFVDSGSIAAIGYCFGGSTVQHLAYSGAELGGAVSFHGSLVTPSEGETKRTKAKILLFHGSQDPLVPKETVQEYISAMNQTPLDWHMIVLGGARHSFTNPGADQHGIEALAYDKTADNRSWAYMKGFFRELFESEGKLK